MCQSVVRRSRPSLCSALLSLEFWAATLEFSRFHSLKTSSKKIGGINGSPISASESSHWPNLEISQAARARFKKGARTALSARFLAFSLTRADMAVRAPHRAASTSDRFCRFVRLRLGRRRFLFDLDQRLETHFAVVIEAGAGRDDVAHDDVLLEAVQVIDTAHGRGFGQDARGVLEGGGAEEGLGFERGLGDAEQDGLGLGGLAAHFLDAVVFVLEVDLVDLFAPQILGVARLGDADLAEHLADDDFDVLVVDGHALEAIDLLHFTHEVLLEYLRAADVEDLVRIDGTFGQLLALLDEVALDNDDVLADGDDVLF